MSTYENCAEQRKPKEPIRFPKEAPVRHRHPFPIHELPGIGSTIARALRESA